MTSTSTIPLTLTTDDGVDLAGDLQLPDPPRAIAALCHPHPQFGGDRFNVVVDALFHALPDAGIAALRFDFRAQYGGGVDERHDVVAALDECSRRLPDVPLLLVGYSFGAVVALTAGDERIAGLALVAPPLGPAAERLGVPPAPARPRVPTLLVVPAHDQFAPPDVVRAATTSWHDTSDAAVPAPTLTIVASADHFLAGHTTEVARRVVAWAEDLLDPGPPGP